MNRDEYNVTDRYRDRLASIRKSEGDITSSGAGLASYARTATLIAGAGALLAAGYLALRSNRKLRRRARRILMKGAA